MLCLQLSYQPPAVYRDMTTGLFPNAWQSRTVDTPALEDTPCLSQITVWQDKPHLPKISNLPWIMEALQSFFFWITDKLDFLLFLKAIFIISIIWVYFQYRQENKTKFHPNKAKSYVFAYKIENTFTTEKHIKKTQMTDLTFRVILFPNFCWICQLWFWQDVTNLELFQALNLLFVPFFIKIISNLKPNQAELNQASLPQTKTSHVICDINTIAHECACFVHLSFLFTFKAFRKWSTKS